MSDGRLLLTRDFGLVWWSQMVSQIGDGVSKLALLWFVYSITGSALKTTVIGLLQTLPPIILGPLIGVYVDRLPKKPILIGTDVLRAILIGLIPCWVPVEAFTVERLYILVLLHAMASAIFGPAMTASIPFLVARSQFTAANALLQSTTSLGIVLGPALSGVGIATLGSQEVLCVNAVAYLVSASCLLPIRLVSEKSPRTGGNLISSTILDLLEGFRFAFVKQRVIPQLILMAALYTFGASAFATLFPVFGRKMLGLGPVEVGYLWSALGIGLFLTSIRLVGLTEWELSKRADVIATSCVICGVALCGLVWASNRLVALLLMGVIGGGKGALTPIAWGVLQEITPRHMVGRVLALYTTGAMAAAITGMITFGWITQEFGERTSVIGIGFILLVTAVAAAIFSRSVRRHQVIPASVDRIEGTTSYDAQRLGVRGD
ncbi:MAG TPA: MFS transporter [Nitrospiraceae bacterium]|nr:MFS transporter [Nitrospiraceae bacterium]